MERVVAAVLGGCLLAAACGSNGGGEEQPAGAVERVRVVASFYPLFEAARQVGGERVEVTNLTAAGVEPHDLELTSRQVDRIEDADVVLYLGSGFQPAVEEVAARTKGEAVDLLDGLPLVGGHGDEEHDEEAGVDPHVWLDLELMQRVVRRVAETLGEVDPEGKAAYGARAEAYVEKLRALDSEYAERLEECERRVVISSHAAFGYLLRRYGLIQEAIAGMSPEAEPDPKRLAVLADLVKETRSTTVFYETLASPRVAETLARETGAATAVLNPLEGLTEAEMAEGKDYLSVMAENLSALVAGLGCR